MAVILITGAKGQLGNELRVASGKYFGYDFVFTDVDELDITDAHKTRDFIHTRKPDWIINCAAYTQVDKAEGDEKNAMLINAGAVRNIASVIKDTTCRFIHISTDYVFEGNSNVPYTESSLTNPLTVYGRSKLEGEKAALAHHATMVIRTSWLYSSFGQNFVKTIIRLAGERDKIKVVSDQIGTPTYAADLADAILSIISGVIRHQNAFNSGIYHYSNEGICSWYDFASAIIEEMGLKCEIIPIPTSEYPTAAKRPVYSVLDKAKIKENYSLNIPNWRTGLQRCLKEMNKKY
jgi:dTDP-4-dehydrorhamnose reductase